MSLNLVNKKKEYHKAGGRLQGNYFQGFGNARQCKTCLAFRDLTRQRKLSTPQHHVGNGLGVGELILGTRGLCVP